MLTNDTFKFLSGLKKNNNKPWFDAHRKNYEAAQEEIKKLVEAWIKVAGKNDESLSALEPKKCIFRINRDIRFSADKTPYKKNLGAYINKGGKNANTAGYYLHIEPGNSFFAAGNWMPTPVELSKIRQEIDYNFDSFKKIINDKKFKTVFGSLSEEGKLKRPPKNYDEANPAIEFLKNKSFIVSAKLKDSELASKDFIKQLSALTANVKPFVDFLNSAIE